MVVKMLRNLRAGAAAFAARLRVVDVDALARSVAVQDGHALGLGAVVACACADTDGRRVGHAARRADDLVERWNAADDAERARIWAAAVAGAMPSDSVMQAVLQLQRDRAAIAEMLFSEMADAVVADGVVFDDEQRGIVLQALEDAVQECINRVAAVVPGGR